MPPADLPLALTFDDVMLRPRFSNVLPSEVSTRTELTSDISMEIPVFSAAMDTVTETELAIALAQAGGLGVIHRNLSPADQANAVRKVKKFESGMVVDPVTLTPDATLADAWEVMKRHRISGLPVVDGPASATPGKLVGMLSNRDVRFAVDPGQPISGLMTRNHLITVPKGTSNEEAKRLLHAHRIEKLLVVDRDYCCIGLITVKDIEKASTFPLASKDSCGRLRVGAAVSVGDAAEERAAELIDAGVDMIVVDTAHGHSRRVIGTVRAIRRRAGHVRLMAGNVVTGDGVRALADVGADVVKIGIGPGSICTTRIVAGVGVPQFSAICEAAKVAREVGVRVVADGGIKHSGDFAKAIAAGADAVMIGSLLAGTDESPGEVFLYQGRSYKSYRGMGSIAAMARGSADRYFQEQVSESVKLVPEGVEGHVPYKGSAHAVLHQLTGGLRAAMGYTGASDLASFRAQAQFIRVSAASLQESHVHDVAITREAPNYAAG